MGTASSAVGDAQESIERLRLVVGLNPGAHIQGLAVADVAFEDRLVGNQNLGAAVGQNAPHLGERELRIQRNRDAAGADDGQKPVEAFAVVGAINGDRLARAQRDRLAQKRIDARRLSACRSAR